jgi:hypothetical protein
MWPYDQILITVRQLQICWCGALSLTRERVCCLQLLLVLASALILGPESRGTRDYILLSQSLDSSNLVGQVPVFISPRNRVAQLYPQVSGSLFVASYDSQGYGWSIRIPLHAEYCHWTGRSRSLLSATSRHTHSRHRAPLEPMAIYLFSVKAFVFFPFVDPLYW